MQAAVEGACTAAEELLEMVDREAVETEGMEAMERRLLLILAEAAVVLEILELAALAALVSSSFRITRPLAEYYPSRPPANGLAQQA
jgi:hypothetical protein